MPRDILCRSSAQIALKKFPAELIGRRPVAPALEHLLKRALDRFALADLVRNAILGELLLDARRKADRYRHPAIVLRSLSFCITYLAQREPSEQERQQ